MRSLLTKSGILFLSCIVLFSCVKDEEDPIKFDDHFFIIHTGGSTVSYTQDNYETYSSSTSYSDGSNNYNNYFSMIGQNTSILNADTNYMSARTVYVEFTNNSTGSSYTTYDEFKQSLAVGPRDLNKFILIWMDHNNVRWRFYPSDQTSSNYVEIRESTPESQLFYYEAKVEVAYSIVIRDSNGNTKSIEGGFLMPFSTYF